MGGETLQFIISLRGGAEAAAEARMVRDAVQGVGGTMKTVSTESEKAGKGVSAFGGGLKRMAIGLAAVSAGYAAWNQAKQAITYTTNLAKSTEVLHKATGMSTEQSSRWVGVAGALGVESAKLGMLFTKLSVATDKQAVNTKGSVTAFSRLGISQKEAIAHQHDMAGLLDLVTGKLGAMQGGTEKTALQLELFGRGWQALNPILNAGAGGLQKWLDMAKRFGVELHGNAEQQFMQLHEKQIEWSMAMDGLRVKFTELAAGPLSAVLGGFTALATALRTNDWTVFDKRAGELGATLSRVVEKVLPKLAETFGHMAPILLKALWRGFTSASLGGEAVIAAVLLTKFGLTSAIFGAAGKAVAGAFGATFAATSAAKVAAAGAADAAVLGGETAAFGVAGGALGAVAAVAFGAALVYGGAKAIHALVESLSPGYLKAHTQQESENVIATGSIHSVHEMLGHSSGRHEAGLGNHPEAGGAGGQALTPAGQAFRERIARRNAAIEGHHPRKASGHQPTLDLAPSPLASLAPGSLSQVVDLTAIVHLDGKEVARSVRRQTLLSEASGA